MQSRITLRAVLLQSRLPCLTAISLNFLPPEVLSKELVDIHSMLTVRFNLDQLTRLANGLIFHVSQL